MGNKNVGNKNVGNKNDREQEIEEDSRGGFLDINSFFEHDKQLLLGSQPLLPA